MPDQATLTNLRGQLEGELEKLRRQIAVLDAGEGTLTYDENFADSGQVAAEQGENRALRGQLRDQLDDIHSALRKIDEGTYGFCERCGDPISEARLEAMPATRFCINHA